MSHTYVHCVLHCVWSTKDRQNFISPDLRERLWPYLGGVARENGMTALAIGGTADHVHILLIVPATITISNAVQRLKGASSHWVHETFADQNKFAWQEGYGAFSIGVSGIGATTEYIKNQSEHHRHKSYMEEYVGFLKKNNLPYDERYVFG